MFHCDEDGELLVLADGPELLVYDFDTEAPLFRSTFPAPIVAVRSTASGVAAVDREGHARWFDDEGHLARAEDLDGPAHAAAIGPDDQLAVALADRVVILAGEERYELDLADVRALAWSEEILALATATELCVAMGPAVIDRRPLPAPPGALAGGADETWVLGVGRDVLELRRGALRPLVAGLPGPAVGLALRGDGTRLAVQLGRHRVVVLRLPDGGTVADCGWDDREVVGVGFGPERWLAVGLDRGDGNKIDLATGDTCRTDPHEGRPRNRWTLSVRADDAEEAPSPSPSRPAGSDAPPSPRRAEVLPLALGAFLLFLGAALSYWMSA